MSIIVDVILAVLLIMAIGYGMSLNRKIVALRGDQGELEKLAASFFDATTRAEASVANLRGAAEESSRLLNEGVGEAGEICDDLKYLIERGESIADKLEIEVRNAERSTAGDREGPSLRTQSIRGGQQEIEMSEAEVLGKALGERVLNEQSGRQENVEGNGSVEAATDRQDRKNVVAKTEAERELIKALQAVR